MKARLYAALLCVAIPGSLVFAGDTTGSNISNGQKCLSYSFTGLQNLSVGALLQNGIGGKYFVSDVMAFRGAVQFATFSSSTPYTGASTTGVDGSASATIVGVTGGLEYHLTQNRISPYVGGEIQFTTTSTADKPPADASGDQTTTDNATAGETFNGTTYHGGLQFDVAAIAGVEFFITKGLSLSAEYMAGLGLNSLYDQTATTGNTTVTTKQGSGFGIGIASTGALTLSAYF
jgi:hypothetical protein